MKRLFAHSNEFLNSTDSFFERNVFKTNDDNAKLRGIIGGPPAGRKAFLAQSMNNAYENDRKVFYLRLTDLSLSINSLFAVANEFYQVGGEIIFIDDIQVDSSSAGEILNLINKLPMLDIVFAGSFLPGVDGDWLKLSELASIHRLPGLSYREFLEYRYKHIFPTIQFDELLELNRNPGAVVLNRIRPLEHFSEYLNHGYYLFESDFVSEVEFEIRLHQLINKMLDSDLSAAYNLDNLSTVKLRKLLMILAEDCLYRPNIEKIARDIGTTRDSLLKFIKYLERAGLIRIVYKNKAEKRGKPQMLCLNNSNLLSALSLDESNMENMYESFLINQLSYAHNISMEEEDCLIIDNKYSFRMTWKTKRAGKGKSPADYSIVTNREYQSGTSLPIWMFGFLY